MPSTQKRATIEVYFMLMDNGIKFVDISKTLENRIKIIINFKSTLIHKLTSLFYKRFLLRDFNPAKLHKRLCASIRHVSQK